MKIEDLKEIRYQPFTFRNDVLTTKVPEGLRRGEWLVQLGNLKRYYIHDSLNEYIHTLDKLDDNEVIPYICRFIDWDRGSSHGYLVEEITARYRLTSKVTFVVEGIKSAYGDYVQMQRDNAYYENISVELFGMDVYGFRNLMDTSIRSHNHWIGAVYTMKLKEIEQLEESVDWASIRNYEVIITLLKAIAIRKKELI